MMTEGSERADVFLVHSGYAETRAEAQAAIRAGRVTADGQTITKAAQTLRSDMKIQYEKAHPYVSRGGVKLAAALDGFGLSPEERICLDVGASTGGFTEVLLARGAAKVYAVDVGHGQLHSRIKTDPRVKSLEGLNARDLTREQVPEPVRAIVADVSFISLKLALPPALSRAASDCWAVVLVKPQFEVGRLGVASGGIVRDDSLRAGALSGITEWLGTLDWQVTGSMESPITGGDGNKEYLVAARKT